MRTLLTGATGFIGAAVARALLRRGHSVVGLVRDAGRAEHLRRDGVELAVGDMWKPETYLPLVASVDAVIHTAQQKTTGRWSCAAILRMHESDALMTRGLAGECQAHGRRFVYTSGGLNYAGHKGDVWLDESTPARPCLLAKAHADLVAELSQRQNLDVVVITPGLVYGAGGQFAEMVAMMRKGRYRVAGRGDNFWSLVHVDDLAELYALALEKAPAGENYFAADDEPVTRREYADHVAAALGVPRAGWIPVWAVGLLYGWAITEAVVANMRMRNARAKTLGWALRYPTLAEGLPAALAALG